MCKRFWCLPYIGSQLRSNNYVNIDFRFLINIRNTLQTRSIAQQDVSSANEMKIVAIFDRKFVVSCAKAILANPIPYFSVSGVYVHWIYFVLFSYLYALPHDIQWEKKHFHFYFAKTDEREREKFFRKRCLVFGKWSNQNKT